MLNYYVFLLEYILVCIIMFIFFYMNVFEVNVCSLIVFFDFVLGLWYIFFIILGF